MAIAVKSTSAFSGIEILDIENGREDKVIWRYFGEKKKHKSIIYFTVKSGRAYFKINGRREYLDEYMRTNYGR